MLGQAGIDAAAGKTAHKLQQLLLAEMHHRIKNLLAMVQSIAIQSLRSAPTLAAAQTAVAARISALSRAHDIMLSSEEEVAPLAMLLAGMTGPFGQENFSIDVPDIKFEASTAVYVSLVINELCTNAVKYGALSIPSGRVSLVGTPGGGALLLTWVEQGGPVVREPTRRSFGTRLIETTAPGKTKLEFRPDGVFCEMWIPVRDKA